MRRHEDERAIVLRHRRAIEGDERRDALGIGKVQHTLLNPSRQALLGARSIQGIASRYGFRARNHFASDYRLMFGESPSQTLQRQSLCAPRQSCT